MALFCPFEPVSGHFDRCLAIIGPLLLLTLAVFCTFCPFHCPFGLSSAILGPYLAILALCWPLQTFSALFCPCTRLVACSPVVLSTALHTLGLSAVPGKGKGICPQQVRFHWHFLWVSGSGNKSVTPQNHPSAPQPTPPRHTTPAQNPNFDTGVNPTSHLTLRCLTG